MTVGTDLARRRWFPAVEQSPEAEAQLFLFPHAGGNALTYRRWGASLPSDLEVRAVQLPGRQERQTEEPFTEVEALVEALLEPLEAELDGHRTRSTATASAPWSPTGWRWRWRRPAPRRRGCSVCPAGHPGWATPRD